MKKILSTSLLVAAMAVAFTGCLKDKGFDNHTYGINDPDTQPPGVGFPYGSNAKNDFGLDAGSTVNQDVTGLLYVNLESGNPASSAVHVTLSNNTTALVAAYNAANGTAIQALPTAIYSFPTSLTINAGGRNAQGVLTVTNTTALNPNVQYAVGITISAVDGGYKIADNLKNLFIVFGIKNQFDGRYNVRGRFHHPSLSNPPIAFTAQVEMWTTGPNSVKMYWPALGGFYSPFSTGPAQANTAFTVQEPKFTVNLTTNKVVVNNDDATGSVYAMSATGFGALPYDHRWDPATKTIYASWGYNLGAGGAFGGNGSASRMWEDTLIRTGPR